MMKECGAEFVGTFMLVSSVCGAALFSAPSVGLIAVALSIGTAVLAMAYALGPISGGHFNPAVTCVILQGAPASGKWNTFLAVSNTYGGTGFPLLSVGLIEIVMTALFLVVITGATSAKASPGFAPIAIGLTLVTIHLVAIPVSNASVNPARSTATAIFGGAEAMQSLWLFWVAPIVGGIIGGLIGKAFYER